MNSDYFLTICLNPTLQKTIVLKQLLENEVNRGQEFFLDASGKGINVSRVLVQLGEKVVHLTNAGGYNRELYLALAKKDNISVCWVESNSEIRFCNTLINQTNHTSTEIIEPAESVASATEAKIYDEFLQLLPKSHTVIISGTKAPGFSDGIYPKMVREAKQAGKKVILDLKGKDLLNSLSYKPDIIKPNVSEFTDTFIPAQTLLENEVSESILEQVQNKLAEIYQQYGVVSVLTRGKYGAILVEHGKVLTIPATPIEPVNTIGCGDAFTAGLASAWYRERDIQKAVLKGMECAKKNALLIHPGVIE